MKPQSPVRVVADSKNMKLGRCAATYCSLHTCPDTCPFRDSGCYAQQGPLGWITKKITDGPQLTLVAAARLEARKIDLLPGDRPLRIHVVGDSTTKTGTRLLAEAARRYMGIEGMPVWTYTHAWATVARKNWGYVSVLASCETATQVRQAHRKGYATALVVDKFASPAAYPAPGLPGFKIIPCPSQTRGITCADCRLCTRAETLHARKLVIAFEAHGPQKNKVREVLKAGGKVGLSVIS